MRILAYTALTLVVLSIPAAFAATIPFDGVTGSTFNGKNALLTSSSSGTRNVYVNDYVSWSNTMHNQISVPLVVVPSYRTDPASGLQSSSTTYTIGADQTLSDKIVNAKVINSGTYTIYARHYYSNNYDGWATPDNTRMSFRAD